MADVVAEGLVRAVGVSNYTASQVIQKYTSFRRSEFAGFFFTIFHILFLQKIKLQRTHAVLAKRNVPLASNQVEFSLLRRSPEFNGLLAVCKQLDVAVIAYSPLAMGRLTGKYSASNPPPASRKFGNAPMTFVDRLVAVMVEIGRAHGGKSPAQVALNWVICKGCFPIVGAKNARQMRENVVRESFTMSCRKQKKKKKKKKKKQINLFFWKGCIGLAID